MRFTYKMKDIESV